MKHLFTLLAALLGAISAVVAQTDPIVISTERVALVYRVLPNGRLAQAYLGKKLAGGTADYAAIPSAQEAYLTHGMEDYYEPALHIDHADGNSSTLLTYDSHTVQPTADGATETVITLRDKVYADEVRLHFTAYAHEDIIKTYAEIKNGGKRAVVLEKYASTMLHFAATEYHLMQFNGDWANEAGMSEQPLLFGKKVIDTKLGTRADMFVSPFFQLSLGASATEESGTVLTGTLGWTGNFRFTFEVDHSGHLRLIAGINPYASQYTLKAGETFRTPDFYFTLSFAGRGCASRNFHTWARQYQVRDGASSRLTLLNNWETTYFDFDEAKLISLIGEAKDLGVDLFLLDDGWFGTKYPRSSDHQGLGDWTEIKDKLPNGIGRLTEEAKRVGVKFGLWIEPEMVNPKSELMEQHPDWVIHLPNREPYYYRNQLVLDLTNPKVQDYVFSIVDNLKTRYPDIAYFKWDCNSPITNIYSPYERQQSHLYVDYVRGLYSVLERIKAKYPDLPMMMCSGGGARTDYEGLRYFTEFWTSDNTDPVSRLFIQWGMSQVFPAKVQCAHVTTWNSRASIKFRTDVAMMGKLGFDIRIADLSETDRDYCRRAVARYADLSSLILDGDRYGLVSPYSGDHTATLYANRGGQRAVLFTFDVHPRYGEHRANVCLRGLQADKQYAVKEILRYKADDRDLGTYSGDYLMTIGLPLFTGSSLNSRVIEVKATSSH